MCVCIYIYIYILVYIYIYVYRYIHISIYIYIISSKWLVHSKLQEGKGELLPHTSIFLLNSCDNLCISSISNS